jgi:transposase
MTGKRYSKEFREEAVRLALESDDCRAKVARDLGVSVWTLREWVRRHEMEFGDSRPRKTETLEEENRRLRRENERLKMERDILKKAAAYFAKEQL